jgi:ferric-dicitrate binding protein FerR (iron transport regulator)
MQDRGRICDTHMELVNHPTRVAAAPAPKSPPPQASGRKRKTRKRRAAAAVATAIFLALAPFAGCTVTHDTQASWGKLHRETQTAVQVAPHLSVDFQPSTTPPPVK